VESAFAAQGYRSVRRSGIFPLLLDGNARHVRSHLAAIVIDTIDHQIGDRIDRKIDSMDGERAGIVEARGDLRRTRTCLDANVDFPRNPSLAGFTERAALDRFVK